MRFAFAALLLALLLQLVFAAAPPADAHPCGAELSAEDKQKVEAELARFREQNGAADKDAEKRSATIPVWFHVVHKDRTSEGGYVRRRQVEEQIRVLNDAFSGKDVSFDLKDIDYTDNADWFNYAAAGNQQDRQMKRRLHRGDKGDLNIYTVGSTRSYPLGWANYPWQYRENPRLDGVVVSYSTLPRGSREHYNQGKTAVHYVGHWVGLYDTYEGYSCSGPGDYVQDTPQERTPTFGCPRYKDTCPGGGPDPIHNYMDYTWDECRYELTRGQVRRYKTALAAYRGY